MSCSSIATCSNTSGGECIRASGCELSGNICTSRCDGLRQSNCLYNEGCKWTPVVTTTTTTTTTATSKEELESYEGFRIAITYFVTFFVAIALLVGNHDNSYNKSLSVVIITSIIYFLLCALFDYLWMKFYLIDNRYDGDIANRDLPHEIIHMVLPGIVLIFGYTFLISGFKSNLSISNTKSLPLFLVKVTALIIIITSYLYYIIKLINIFNDSSHVRNKEDNTQIDILYSILHPVSILLISGIFYAIILIFLKQSYSNGNTRNMNPSPSPTPIPIPNPIPSPSPNPSPYPSPIPE